MSERFNRAFVATALTVLRAQDRISRQTSCSSPMPPTEDWPELAARIAEHLVEAVLFELRGGKQRRITVTVATEPHSELERLAMASGGQVLRIHDSTDEGGRDE